MSKWLKCKIRSGQFSGEYSVTGKLFNGNKFSLFAQERDLQPGKRPRGRRPVSGLIRIKPLKTQRSLSLVSLPESTLESGCLITVKNSDLKD